MNLINTYTERLQPMTKALSDLSLLCVRLWLAQEFIYAGYQKLSGGFTPPEWFTELQFPVPFSMFSMGFNWGLSGIAELLFGAMLLLGLFARFSAFSLLVVTYVAVYSVHFDLGWAGWRMIETEDGLGFKVPLMIGLMLLVVLGQGAGHWSIDGLIKKMSFKKGG